MAKIKKKRVSIGFSYNSPVILTFAILSLAVLLLGTLTDGKSTSLLFSVYRFRPTDVLGYLRLFLHVLGHSNWEHFFANVGLLLVVGPLVEEKYGSKSVLVSIAATALVTGILHIIISPGTALLGASGIVFMLILMASITNFRSGYIPLTLIVVALIYIGSEIYNGIIVADDISQLTHIAGGIMGIVCGIIFSKHRL